MIDLTDEPNELFLYDHDIRYDEIKCRFEYLLSKNSVPHTELDELCKHEDECKIMSQLIKKFKKTNPGLALILILKLETYKNNKLPKGVLKI